MSTRCFSSTEIEMTKGEITKGRGSVRTLAIGDIHGACRALEQVWGRAKVQPEDRVIFLGDVCDGWPEVVECMEFLLRHENIILLAGNHDEWADQYRTTGRMEYLWVTQGGKVTLESFQEHGMEIPDRYFPRLRYFHEEDGRLFVHGGYIGGVTIHEQSSETLLWDRDLWYLSDDSTDVSPYSEVFIGHTATVGLVPVNHGPVWNLDQGAGWNGVLTIMDVETKEYWQSDPVKSLYPEVKGR